jgi:hypothetical protein
MLTYVVIALIVGAALALAVALASSDAGTSGAASAAGEVAGATLYSETTDAALAAADPAKEQPLLDKFTSKDPFIPFAQPGTSAGTPTPSPTGTSQPTTLAAKVKVDGTSYNVMVGDKVPGGSAAAFTVTAITSSDVTFEIIDGELENGDTSFSVNLGETVRVTEKTSGVSYDISVTAIGASGGGGGSGGGGSTAHSITVLSVTSQNGTALVTIEVDGKTYSDKKVGAVVVTSWGEIKVLAIDVDAQTVTIMHGDQTLTLSAGQVVVK